MSLVTIRVDNTAYKIEEGKLLIDALIDNKIEIPYFCYHEALGADGNCRMCMVEIEGKKRPQIACDTFVEEGMEVRTRGEKINFVRQRILELELINHPVDCPICDQAGECKLQDFYMEYGLYDSHVNMEQKVHNKKHVDLGSNIILDQERCVLCARCTRFTSNVTKTGELGIINRGDHACVSTVPGMKLENPYAMNIVDLCPVGALTSKDFRFHQRVWFLQSSEAICQGCAKGCNIYIDHNKQKYQKDIIYRFRPRINKNINGHFICDEGRLSYHTLQSDRQLVYEQLGIEIKSKDFPYFFGKYIKEAKNIGILIDANLYLEDISAIMAYAKEIDAEVIAPMSYYYDEEFGDDWLKSNWRCANKKGIEEFDLQEEFESDVDLILNFNHPIIKRYKELKVISFQTHTSDRYQLVAPIPVYSEYGGTLINEDGVKQYSNTAVRSHFDTISQWLHTLQEEIK
jgi:NADH-quinone oxidoreductase subunit G